MVEVKKLTKIYDNGENECKVLNEVSHQFKEGELNLIIGPSGGGKTTLLNIIGMLDTATSGEVVVDNQNITQIQDEEQKLQFRREHISIIFQDFNLIESLTAYENIILTASLQGRKIEKDEVTSLAKKLKIEDKLNSFPSKLSGGQRQRIAIARALYAKTPIILADEPTGNLDTKTSHEVMELFTQCIEEYQVTIIMVTHNMDFTKYTNNIINLVDGKIH